MLSAHLLVRDLRQWETVLDACLALLDERFGIHHVTLQPEPMARTVHWLDARAGKRAAISGPGKTTMAFPATRQRRLDVQIEHVQGVLFDEIPSRFDLIAHQRGEHFVGGDGILDAYLQQATGVWIHGGFPTDPGSSRPDPL